MFILHGNPYSTCTRRVIVCMVQMGLKVGKDFEVDIVDLARLRTPEWLTHQPFGQMPWLEDTETSIELFESRAISLYIASRIKSPLVPSTDDPKAYADFQRAYSAEVSNFDPYAMNIANELLFKPRFGQETDHKQVGILKETLTKRLKGYETILSKSRYVAGDQLTLADLFHLPYGEKLEELKAAPGISDDSLPSVNRWWKEISSLESWATANSFIPK